MTEIGRPSDVREGYHHVLLEIHDQCNAHGMVFAHELRQVCYAWYVTHCRVNGLERDETILQPDPDGEYTPGTQIMENVMNDKPSGRIIKAPVNQGYAKHATEPPSLPANKVKKGPSVAEMVSLGEKQWMRIDAGEMQLVTLQRRITQANGEARKKFSNPKFRLVCWEAADKSLIIRHG